MALVDPDFLCHLVHAFRACELQTPGGDQCLFKTLGGGIAILCVLASLGIAEDGPAVRPSKVDDKAGDRITKVVTVDEDGIIRTKIFIQLQHPPDSMEPVAEPRRIQVDDRANVQLVLRNVSPLDVCTLNGRTPAMTVETNVAESVVGTIAKLAPFSIAPAAENLASPSQLMLDTLSSQITREFALARRPHSLPQRECNVEADPEYIRLVNLAKDFNEKAQALVIGTFDVTKCDKAQLTAPTEFRLDGQEQLDDQQQLADQKQPAGEKEKPLLSQAELACQIDAANSKLNDFVGKDYRGAEQAKFDIHSSDLDYVKLWFGRRSRRWRHLETCRPWWMKWRLGSRISTRSTTFQRRAPTAGHHRRPPCRQSMGCR